MESFVRCPNLAVPLNGSCCLTVRTNVLRDEPPLNITIFFAIASQLLSALARSVFLLVSIDQ